MDRRTILKTTAAGSAGLVTFAPLRQARAALANVSTAKYIAVEVGGGTVGYLNTFQAPSYEIEDISPALGPDGTPKVMLGNPKIGEATATFTIAQSRPLFDWVAGFLQKKIVERDVSVMLADQDYEVKRRIDMASCLVTGVEFPTLDAKDGKKHFEVTARFKPEQIKYNPGGGKVAGAPAQKNKTWLASNFRVTMPGIRSEHVTKIELPKLTAKIAEEAHGASRLPTRHYASIDIGALKIEFSSVGFEAAKDLAVKVIQDGALTDDEYLDIAIDLYDPYFQTVLATFACTYCGPKRFDWSAQPDGGKDDPAPSTLELSVGEIRLDVK